MSQRDQRVFVTILAGLIGAAAVLSFVDWLLEQWWFPLVVVILLVGALVILWAYLKKQGVI